MQHQAAVTLQRIWRTRMQRHTFLQTRRAVLTLQAYTRGWRCRRRLAVMVEAAVVVQRRWRARQLGRAVMAQYCQSQQAVIVVQRCIRTWLTRRHFLQQRKAAVVLQAAIRAHQQRKEYLRLKKAALLLQRCWREKLQQQQILAMKVEAAVTIQKYYRGWVDRKHYLSVLHNVRVIQMHVRAWQEGHKVREHFLATRQAAITVQRLYRARQQRLYHQERNRAATVLQAQVSVCLCVYTFYSYNFVSSIE